MLLQCSKRHGLILRDIRCYDHSLKYPLSELQSSGIYWTPQNNSTLFGLTTHLPPGIQCQFSQNVQNKYLYIHQTVSRATPESNTLVTSVWPATCVWRHRPTRKWRSQWRPRGATGSRCQSMAVTRTTDGERRRLVLSLWAVYNLTVYILMLQSSRAVWKSRWPSWAPRPWQSLWSLWT